MAQWECIVCGYIYDETKGDPEHDIAPGTLWKDVPEDWICPDCGVGKEDFELIAGTEAVPSNASIEEHVVVTAPSSHAAPQANAPIIIIGSGLAAYNLIKEFRRLDHSKPVIIITEDDGRSYSKPMLSTGFTKENSADDLVQKDAGGMARQFNCSIWTMTKVTSINTQSQQISLDSGINVAYSQLVLAVGAEPIRPPMTGDALDAVYSVNSLNDYDIFRKALVKSEAKKVAIIGGGLIGSEFTNDLLNGGFETETVDPLGYSLPTLLPEAAGKAVQAALEEKGAKFHFGPLANGEFGPVATAVNRSDNGVEVVLNNGQHIAADIVLSAVGVRPRLELAKAAGIKCNRGIITDRYLETSAKNIYSLGDCAEVSGQVLFYVAPLMACAKALAQTLSGDRKKVVYPAMPVTIKTPACPVVVSPPPRDANGQWHIEQDGHNIVAEFKDPIGDLIGFALTGEGTKEKLRLQKELPPILL